jgi:hypothetical protein
VGRARRPLGWLLLLGLIGLGAVAAAVIVADFVARPRDIWAAVLFASGGLAGAAFDRGRRRG